jgi:hypothetical protein
MPFPLLAGIPWLAGIVAAAFVSLFTFFAKYLTKKFAVVAVAITMIVGLTAGFISALTALTSAITFAAPPWYSLAVQLVVPDNATTCISIIFTAHLLRYAYDWNVKIIQYKIL